MFCSSTGHLFEGLVRQLRRGIPSLVPVPIKIISDWPACKCASAFLLASVRTQCSGRSKLIEKHKNLQTA